MGFLSIIFVVLTAITTRYESSGLTEDPKDEVTIMMEVPQPKGEGNITHLRKRTLSTSQESDGY